MKKLKTVLWFLPLLPWNLSAANLKEVNIKASHLMDLQEVFLSSPFIYSFLLLLSVISLTLWLYTFATFRPKELLKPAFSKNLLLLLQGGRWEGAKEYCHAHPNLLSSIVLAGLMTRQFGHQVMLDAMKTESKRVSTPFWQRLSLLHDIGMVAPMLGLLGTVMGMFYAFYDVNRSIESINALFDGLGIAVGTTVVGLVVAILSMIFATTLKYRLVQVFSQIENEALILSTSIPEQHTQTNTEFNQESIR